MLRATSTSRELGDNAPPGFVPLVLSTSKTKTAIRRPHPLHTQSVRVYGAGIGASVNTPYACYFLLGRDHCADDDPSGLPLLQRSP